MSTGDDLIEEIRKMERASKSMLPFTAIGLAGVLAAIYISATTLRSMREDQAQLSSELAQLAAERALLDMELARKQQEIANADLALTAIQARVDSLQVSVASISSDNGDAGDVPSHVEDALMQAAAIDAAIAVASADLKTPKTEATASAYGSISVDVFFCPDNAGINEPRANRLMTEVGAAESGRWRVRLLSPEVNARSGYRISSDVVRFNRDERDIAERLQRDARRVTGKDVAIQEIASPTPGYVSVFLCSGA